MAIDAKWKPRMELRLTEDEISEFIQKALEEKYGKKAVSGIVWEYDWKSNNRVLSGCKYMIEDVKPYTPKQNNVTETITGRSLALEEDE